MSTDTKPSPASPTKFVLPDLVSHCTFPIHTSRHRKQVTTETKRWLFHESGNLMGQSKAAYIGLKCGLLTAMVYPFAGYGQLRVCNDFLTYLFHLDNLSDDMDNRGTIEVRDVVINSLERPFDFQSNSRLSRLTKDYWKRLIQTGSAGCQRRFIETFDAFFQSVTQQAIDRREGEIPDLESYITLRRDTSGCRPCFALTEYANNLFLPDEVMAHPLIQSLGDASNDLITWSNDIFSYNVEQSKGDTHNMIPVVMNQYGLELQPAVDFVGQLCKQSIDRFIDDRARLPSWGPEIDRDVQIYVDGLADWIVGSLHWSFETERYFGKNGRETKSHGIIHLIPRRDSQQ